MSGLAALLGDREPAGVYRWHSGLDAADVAHAVEVAGAGFAHLDGWLAGSRAEVLAALGVALGFPEHYGQNLDALVDCLRDVGRGDRSAVADGTDRATVLLWDGWGTLAHADPRTFGVVLDILAERSGDADRPTFSVLLRGEGPEPAVAGVPELS